ncbi:MAG: VIT1/CCC1 transporter family protein [Chloroflexota bacterium]|nr:VIT1/CCC1 transporter family protein [Chloroflexota bacterium]
MADAAPESRHLDRDWLRDHIAEERRQADVLGEIREAIFGAQDGLTSTIAVLSAVAAATSQTYPVLVAGVASALAGVFSMAAGEYTSSKSQREIFEAQIQGEREEVEERPDEAQAELAYMFEEDGLGAPTAHRVSSEIAREPRVLLKTMVEKELGLVLEERAGPLQGALVMGGAFGVGSIVPLLPYFFLHVQVAIWASIVISALFMFGIGWVKAQWTRKSPLRSGLEILAIGAAAGVAGYLFGIVLPSLLGVAGITVG